MCYVGFGNKTKDWDDQISQIIKWRRWLEGQAYIELLSFAEVLSRKNILFATPDANNLAMLVLLTRSSRVTHRMAHSLENCTEVSTGKIT